MGGPPKLYVMLGWRIPLRFLGSLRCSGDFPLKGSFKGDIDIGIDIDVDIDALWAPSKSAWSWALWG